MRKSKIILAALFLGLATILNSCYQPPADVYGCMDIYSENYNSEATIDDGNCEYPYEKFLGIYHVYEVYSTTSCGSGTDDYYTEIQQGSSYNKIKVVNLGGISNIEFTVDVNQIDGVPRFNLPSPVGTVDFQNGDGVLTGDIITLTYRVSDVLHSMNCGYYDVTASFYKQ